jgi:hypothetical protein
VPYRSVVTSADLDGDGKYEMYVGNKLGGLMFYRQNFMVGLNPIESSQSDILFYPNPCTNELFFETDLAPNDYRISLYDISGKKVKDLIPDVNQHRISLDQISKGFYLIGVQQGEILRFKKMLIE